YSEEEYLADLAKVTDGRNDPDLSAVLVAEAAAGLRWLKQRHGMRYRLMYERQSYERPDGSYLFWGGLHVGNVGGGEGLIADATAGARRAGIEIRYEHHVTRFGVVAGAVVGGHGSTPEGAVTLRSDSVILAAGSFEADP